MSVSRAPHCWRGLFYRTGMGYLTVAVILGVVLLIGIMAVVFMPSSKRRKRGRLPDGVSYNRPQNEGGTVETKPQANHDSDVRRP